MSTLTLKVNGFEYSNFTSASCSLQLDTLAGQFSFSAIATKNQVIPFNVGDECQVDVNGIKVLTGYIELSDVDYDSTSHDISYLGRSKTGDLIESYINTIEINAPVSLKSVIEQVIKDIGMNVKVINQVPGLLDFTKTEDIISPKVGENAFLFIEKLARKRQVLLTTDADGNVVIVKPNADTAPTGLQNAIGKEGNNIETGSISRDETDLYNKYISKSQANLSTLNFSGETKSKDIVSQKSPVVLDKNIRPSRQLVFQAESSSSDLENENRAKWEQNIRQTRSMVYSVTVATYGADNKLWMPNQIVNVNDEFAGINGQMLINSVTFLKEANITETTIGMVNKKSYTLELNEPVKQKNASVTPTFS